MREFLFDGIEPRTLRPDVDRSRPIAPAAEPLASFSAAVSNELRDSLSHQNSHERESRDLPLKERWSDLGVDIEAVELTDAERSVGATWTGRGGDGDEASLVTISALPSALSDRRTTDVDFLSRRAGVGYSDAGELMCSVASWQRGFTPELLATYAGGRVCSAECDADTANPDELKDRTMEGPV